MKRIVLTSLLPLLCLLALVHSLPAGAQDLRVVVEGPLEEAPFRSGLSADLQAPLSDEAEGMPMLRLIVEGNRAILIYTGAGGERRREIELPGAEDQAVEVLVLAASNLVRDQASDLIVEQSNPAPVENTPLSGEAVGQVEAGPTQNYAELSPLHFGASVIGGVANAEQALLLTYGISLTGTVHPNISFGVTRLNIGVGYSTTEGTIFFAGGTPMLEAYAFVHQMIQVYGQVGVALQGRSSTSVREGNFQAAPSLVGGVRFWASNWISVGLEVGLHVVATDAYRMGDLSLSQGSVPGTLGLGLEFHFDP